MDTKTFEKLLLSVQKPGRYSGGEINSVIKDKSKIRLAGEGADGINGGKNGDLYITIHIKEAKAQKTKGLNIYKTVEISPVEAILGTNLIINTPSGKVNAKIAPYTNNGQKIRLSNCGLVQNNSVGDMIITVEIQIPKSLSEKEINLYKQLGDLAGNNTREI